MNMEPYPGDVALTGPHVPCADRLEDLLKLLVTIHKRFGNTSITYRLTWGGIAMCVQDAQQRENARLKKANAKLRKQLREERES